MRRNLLSTAAVFAVAEIVGWTILITYNILK